MVGNNGGSRAGAGRPFQEYTLTDGTKWTARQILMRLRSRWKQKDIAMHLVRGRLLKHRCPDKLFAKPALTKPRTKLTITEKDIDREMMNLALKSIGGRL
jgi:hypothetical protein